MTAGGEGSVLRTGKKSLHGAIKLPSFKVQIWYFIYIHIENIEELI